MKNEDIEIEWPNGLLSHAKPGTDWIVTASEAGIEIPTGCLGGSCGACEIEVNGEVVRACITVIEDSNTGFLDVSFIAIL